MDTGKGVSLGVSQDNPRVIALVGASGCGKSTCIALMERFYDPLAGRVTFCGRDIRELENRWYRKNVSIVQQEPALFGATIKQNICYGFEEEMAAMSEEEQLMRLDEACHAAHCYDFLHDEILFPEGYATAVGERGGSLSGGQKQRIAIARALIRKPKVLLLDEATSALDAESEGLVQEALNKLIESRQQTVVIVAHRLSTVKDADEIIVMEYGSEVERGTHRELVKIPNGKYAKLVQRQLVEDNLKQVEAAEKQEGESIRRRQSFRGLDANAKMDTLIKRASSQGDKKKK